MIVKRITLISIMTCILAITSPIALYIGPIPITILTFMIYIIGSIVRPIDSVLICLVYISLGLIGLPIFSSFTSGLSTILGPTGGYIIGYVPCILIISLFVNLNKKNICLYFIGIILGTIICYMMGIVWYMIYANVTFIYALSICLMPFIIFDLLKIIVSAIVGFILNKKININPYSI